MYLMNILLEGIHYSLLNSSHLNQLKDFCMGYRASVYKVFSDPGGISPNAFNAIYVGKTLPHGLLQAYNCAKFGSLALPRWLYNNSGNPGAK